MNLLALFTTNLTSYHNVELWITRSCLLISISIIGPTIILFVLDLLLWCFRAGQGPSSDLIRRSRSGIDLLQQKARLRSNSTSSSTSSNAFTESTSTNMKKGITPLTQQSQNGKSSEKRKNKADFDDSGVHVAQKKERDELRQLDNIKLNRERTNSEEVLDGTSDVVAQQAVPVVKMVGIIDSDTSSAQSVRETANVKHPGTSTGVDATRNEGHQRFPHADPAPATLADYKLGKVLE